MPINWMARGTFVSRGDHEIGDPLVAGRHELGPDSRVGELHICGFDFGQHGFCAANEFLDRQAVSLVIIFVRNVIRGGADEDRVPQRARQVNSEAQPVGVRKRVDQIVDEIRFGAHQFAVFSAHGKDAIVAISKHRGDFIGVQAPHN